MHPRCISQAITYLSEAAIVPQSYEVMKPHMESLVLHVVFPLLCFSDEDRQLWEEDPQEYVRKGYDVIEDLYSEKNAATVFLVRGWRSCDGTATLTHSLGLSRRLLQTGTGTGSVCTG